MSKGYHPKAYAGKSNNISMKAITKSSVLLLLMVAFGADAEWECGERSNLPIEGRNYCAAGDFRQSEINLKKVLDSVLKYQMTAFGDNSVLTQAQRAFESYRDKQCEAENKRIQSKPFHPMIVAQCKTRLTNARIEELTRMQTRER